MIRLSPSTKFMGIGIILSLGWFVLESCECDQSKENKFPGEWVACNGDTAVLMGYFDNTPVTIAHPPSNFNPADWDCKHDPNSPPYKNGQAGVNPPYPFYSPSGPGDRKTPSGELHSFLSSTTIASTAFLARRSVSGDACLRFDISRRASDRSTGRAPHTNFHMSPCN